jgi:hypothetical protein
MFHALYIAAFLILTVIAVSNLVRNMMLLAQMPVAKPGPPVQRVRPASLQRLILRCWMKRARSQKSPCW